MAGTLPYLYEPNQTVYVITNCIDPNISGVTDVLAVRLAQVIRVRFEVLVTETVLEYDVQIEQQSGTTVQSEGDIFESLADAVTEYQIRLA